MRKYAWPSVAGCCGSALLLGLTACGGGGGGGTGATSSALAVAEQTQVSPDNAASTSPSPSASAAVPAPASAPVAAPAPLPISQLQASAAPTLGQCELFPSTAVFNTRIDDAARFPSHARSSAWINMVGSATPFRADWWLGEDPTRRDAYYGIPINVVDTTSTDWPLLAFDFAPSGASTQQGYPHESDCAVPDGSGAYRVGQCSSVPAALRRFPFPRSGVKNEGGACNDPNTCGDHHVLVVEQGACRLWESFAAYPLSGQWYAMSSAAWNLKSLALRPDGWTAGDAAGLPITPFLVKEAEASSGEIRHALRVTLRDSVLARTHQWPARHGAGDDTPGGIPFGSVLRLKADFVIPDSWNAQAKAIATAAKRYGLYVSDVGMDFYVQGEPNVRWQENTFRQLQAIPLSQMEFVDLGAITRDPRFSNDSMAASW
jgi:hypothetical protein